MAIYPGQKGAGILVCAQFYEPVIGDNELGFAAVALHYNPLDAP
jgi:hypothetical protein